MRYSLSSTGAYNAASASSPYLEYSECNLQNFTQRYNRFDKLCLSSRAEYACKIDYSKFDRTESASNQSVTYRYCQREPFYLCISISDTTLRIEFTGKVLLDDYPQLISYKNIDVCFENINALDVCRIDTASVLNDSRVYACDVIGDIHTSVPLTVLKSPLVIKSNRRWCISESTDFKLRIQNTVITKRNKTAMVIYDKHHEINMADNRMFLSVLKNPPKLLACFKNAIRYELNLKSVACIRKYLQLTDNSLKSVLYSSCDAIANVLDEIFEPSPVDRLCLYASSIKEFKDLLLLAVRHSTCISKCTYGKLQV